MLADSVEASTRTLVDPTPARIRTHIENIVKGIYSEGQLDESDLAFRDLNKIIDQFVRIITGQFHQRIAYPEAVKAKAKAEEKARAASEEVEDLKPEWVMGEGEKEAPRENSKAHAHKAEKQEADKAQPAAEPEKKA
jgi:hypothetical protein